LGNLKYISEFREDVVASIKWFLLKLANERKGFSVFDKEGLESLKEKVRNIWIPELPEEKVPDKAGGVDGSRIRISYAGYLVYALGAASVVFEGAKEVKFEVDGDIDILSPKEFSDSRLRILMGIVEYKRALSILPEVSVLFLDGSIAGALLRPSVFVYQSALMEDVKSYINGLFEELKKSYTLRGINSKRFYGEISKKFKGEDFAFACGYLEYLEYLHTLYLLLKEADSLRKTVISVSKTSDSRVYDLHPISSDIAVLSHVNPPSGYSRPVTFSLEKEEKFKFPVSFDSLLRKFSFSEFFLKLREGKGIYKIETSPPSKFAEAVSYLRYYGTEGYNYLLKVAHERVKISSHDMETIIKVMNFKGVTGREALGE
jgi:NurA-like 5'-3' nuclease